MRVCHPDAASYRDLELQQIYRIHENEKKRLYSRRVLDIKHETFTLLVFTTTGGMGTLFNFPLFICSDFLIKNAIDLENIFFNRNGLF